MLQSEYQWINSTLTFFLAWIKLLTRSQYYFCLCIFLPLKSKECVFPCLKGESNCLILLILAIFIIVLCVEYSLHVMYIVSLIIHWHLHLDILHAKFFTNKIRMQERQQTEFLIYLLWWFTCCNSLLMLIAEPFIWIIWIIKPGVNTWNNNKINKIMHEK